MRTAKDAAAVTETLLTMERAALDRWGRGDPSGFLEISAPDVAYFDPFVPDRVDGWPALKAHYEPVRGTIRVDRYDMKNPAVTVVDSMAMMTFNLVNYVTENGIERVTTRWNCTEVYQQTGGTWRIIHSHWSWIMPTPA